MHDRFSFYLFTNSIAQRVKITSNTTHIVQKGETLAGICEKYGILESHFLYCNPIFPRIYDLTPLAGKVLFIPIKVNVFEQIFLRKESSVKIIHSMMSNWEAYTRLFAVQSGLDESYGNGDIKIFPLLHKPSDLTIMEEKRMERVLFENTTINFLTAGQVAATFSWPDKRTLSQIEEMSGYVVKPRGVVSAFRHGGYVVYENDGHGLVVSFFDIGKSNWEDAKTLCDNFVISGYDDWYLPSKEDLLAFVTNCFNEGFGGVRIVDCLDCYEYWSDSKKSEELMWIVRIQGNVLLPNLPTRGSMT